MTPLRGFELCGGIVAVGFRRWQRGRRSTVDGCCGSLRFGGNWARESRETDRERERDGVRHHRRRSGMSVSSSLGVYRGGFRSRL